MAKKAPTYQFDPKTGEVLCKKGTRYNLLKRDDSDQLVVYRENSDTDKFNKWLNTLEEVYDRYKNNTTLKTDKKKKGKKIEVLNFCGKCNDSLVLLVAKNIKTVIATEVAKKSSSSAGPLQDDGLVFTSNVKVKFPVRKPKAFAKRLYHSNNSNGDNNLEPVNVAVFDTGIISEEFEGFFPAKRINNPCVGIDNVGWNFTVPSSNFKDNHPMAHGTTVSRFIVDEYSKAEGTRPLKIIPVKVHDKDGNSDLYSVLCALIYAQKQGAHIINASFGFYVPKEKKRKEKVDPTQSYKKSKQVGTKPKKLLKPAEQIGVLGREGADLLKRFIQKHLTDKGILVVAAAGNKATKAQLKSKFGIMKPPKDQRDLSKLDFYPASLSADLPNVIAVTTVNPVASKVSNEQNFSKEIVNIGVRSDISTNFGFRHPRLAKRFIKGSSYAAPIVTGLLAANFSEFTQPFDKKQIIETLLKKGKLEKKPNLAKFIDQGVVL